MKRNTNSRGFALVLSLLFLAFLLLLIVSFAAFIRIETQSNANNLQWAKARQHALLGLNIALGELQQKAGPDARISAAAHSIYDFRDGRDYWTGIWNSDGSFEGWLSSEGLEDSKKSGILTPIDDPTLLNNSVWLLNNSAGGVSSPESRIALTKQSITSTQVPGFSADEKIVTGNYAYWVGDEGVKATILKPARISPPLPANEFLRNSTIWKTETEVSFSSFDDDTANVREQLSLQFTLEQINTFSGIGDSTLAEHYHHITPVSFGVLSSTKKGPDGGMKRDLSQSGWKGTGALPNTSSVNRFINNAEQSRTAHPVTTYSPVAEDKPVYTASPVLVELSLRFSFLSPEDGSANIRMRQHIKCDLWNPYTFDIKLNAPESSNPWSIEIAELPVFTIEYKKLGSTTIEDSYNLLPAENPITLTQLNTPETLESGIIIRAESEDTEIELVKSMTDTTPAVTDDDLFSVFCESSKLSIRLKYNGEIVQEFRNLPFAALTRKEINWREDEDKTMPLRLSFYFQDSEAHRWYNELDPRGPIFDFTDSTTKSMILSSYDWDSSNDDSEFDKSFRLFNIADEVKTTTAYRMFDYPTVEMLSVASFRHMAFNDQQPYAVGSSGTHLQNEIFDQFYFSTISGDINSSLKTTESGVYMRPFTNPHLAVYNNPSSNELEGTRASEHLLTQGAFNINSTSKAAWLSLLTRHDITLNKDGLDYMTSDDRSSKDLYPFFRFPYTTDIQENFPASADLNNWNSSRFKWFGLTPTEGMPWQHSYAFGIRALKDSQIEDLVDELILLIEKRSEPFLSVEEFVSSGILQKAINARNINTTNQRMYDSTSDSRKIPFNTPGFLNQSDILQQIAPVIQARSDTFIIRTYGDVVNPVTGKLQGRAWCEARVQRVPERIDESSDPQNEATGFGRKFKMVQFKWLVSSEI